MKKRKKKDRVNDLYVWCMMFWGHLPDSRYTGTLQTVWGKHVCTVNVWDWTTGPRERRFLGEEIDWRTDWWWMERGWFQCCCGLSGFLGVIFRLWSPEAGWRFLPVCLAPRPGTGVIRSFWGLWPKVPLPLVTVWQELFGVFGAATKCAMCYVAWFIIFLQATKLICSPIV